MKKSKPYYGEFNDEPEFFDDESDAFEEPPVFSEDVIIDECGPANAAKGRTLLAGGAVVQRLFDGETLRAEVLDAGRAFSAGFDLSRESSFCGCPNHPSKKRGPYDCEHVAALMYAFAREPQTFFPQNIGGFLQAVQGNPALRDMLGVGEPELNAIVTALQKAPPEMRAALENLPLTAAAADIAKLTESLPALPPVPPEEEMKGLLEGLALNELQALAKRRRWSLTGNAKPEIVPQLVERLRAAPQPDEFTSEEEQLLRIENTLFGLEDVPQQSELEAAWKKRGGGDVNRLAHAVEGLRTAGALFRCARERGPTHYHWSPFLQSTDLPLLRPKAKPYPVEALADLHTPAPALPLLTMIDAALEFAEREPLRVRSRDPKFSSRPYIGDWDYDPREVEKLPASGVGPWGGANTLTVPLPPFFADETLDGLATFVGEARDYANWLAGLLWPPVALVQPTDGTHTVVNPARVKEWRALSVEEQYRLLWHAWLTGATTFGELGRAAARASFTLRRSLGAKQFTKATLAEEIGAARRFVTRLLTRLEPNRWYEWQSFADYLRELRADFLHTATTEEAWFLAPLQAQQTYLAQYPESWNKAHRPILATMLEDALRWFGAVEPGYVAKKLAAFQITPLGEWLLTTPDKNERGLLTEGKSGTPLVLASAAEESAEAVTWLDAETFRVRARVDTAQLVVLARTFADPTRERLVFRVSNATLARAFEQGITTAEITQKFVEAGAPLPAPLSERLAALEANYGRVRVYERLTLLELADDLALRELLAGTSLGARVVHQFSPRLVVLKDEDVDELVNELVKKGYTPGVK